MRSTLRSIVFLISTFLAAMVVLDTAQALAVESAARTWNELLLSAIRSDTARPTVHSRNLYHLSAAMYDAWAAYDDVAQQVFHAEKFDTTSIDVAAARHEAISFAAYRVLQHRFVTGPGGVGPGRDLTDIETTLKMLDLNYDPSFTSTLGNSPAALGNRIAQSVIAAGLIDGANEVDNYDDTSNYMHAPLLDWEQPGTSATDPNRWEPLSFSGQQTDKLGNPVPGSNQSFTQPHWNLVKPFALAAEDRTGHGVYFDQGTPPMLGGVGDHDYKIAIHQLIELSSKLDPNLPETIDISPAAMGNRPLDSYADTGYATNPYTGQPYASNVVNHGDYGRAMTEFFSDPPTQWNDFGKYLVDRMESLGIAKQIGGTGPVVDDLEWDVKLYLGLNGALFDAGIAAWDHKRYYDYARPITMIRYMAGKGQSSDPQGPSYHPEGLLLEDGLVEVISSASTAAGARHEHLAGHEGEIAIFAYRGPLSQDGVDLPDPPFDNPGQVGGVGWILANEWVPYQLPGFVTPPFPGFVSGHSTYARAAAEFLTGFTGSPFFPGGIGEFTLPEGTTFLTEFGPSEDLTFTWATYFDAADASGFARLYGGIHVPADDLGGRNIGHLAGLKAWHQASRYYAGVPEPGCAALCAGAIALLMGRTHESRKA